MKISQEELKLLVCYDESSGDFTNIVDRKSSRGWGRVAKAGESATRSHSKGYLSITINKHTYMAHRLAWLYVHGEFPKSQIDHIDGDRKNNSLKNLRSCSQFENMQNVVKYKEGGHSSHIGVSYNTTTKRWHAYITHNGKQINRSCNSEAGAVALRKELKEKYHTFNPFDREAA